MDNEKINDATIPHDEFVDNIVLDIKDLVVHNVLEGETARAVNGVTLSQKKGDFTHGKI